MRKIKIYDIPYYYAFVFLTWMYYISVTVLAIRFFIFYTRKFWTRNKNALYLPYVRKI